MAKHGWSLGGGGMHNHDALTVIRDLQPKVRPLGYHIALGGGVLNNGWSGKDLDLYLLPLVDTRHDCKGLLRLLDETFTDPEPIGSGGTDNGGCWYRYKIQYKTSKGRIDVFVVDHQGEHEQQKEGTDGDSDPITW